MKKFLKIFLISFGILLLAMGIGIVVYIYVPIGHKAKMCAYVNKGEFEKAASEITHIDNWRLENDSHHFIDCDSAFSFVRYMDSIGVAKDLRDSFYIYTARECDMIAAYCSSYDCEYNLSVYFWKLSCDIKQSILGEKHPDYVFSLAFLGNAYKYLGYYGEAANCYLQALEIRRTTLGENHPDFASSLDDIGQFCHEIGDYKNAEMYYLRALTIRDSVLGVDDKHSMLIRSNLGLLYMEKGEYTKAESYFLQALNYEESTYGKEHPYYAISLNNLGLLYYNMSDYIRAEQYYIQALKIFKSELEDNHSYYAKTLGNLGNLYKEKGEYSKAESYFLQEVDIMKSIYGENHPDYASAVDDIGSLYLDMGDYDRAESCFLQTLEIYKSVFGEMNDNYANVLDKFGQLYYMKGDYLNAESYYFKALEIKRSILGENNTTYAHSLNNIGSLYLDMGDFNKAESYYLRALEIKQSVLGEKSLDYAGSLHNMSILYDVMGDYIKKEKYCVEAFNITKAVVGEHSPQLVSSLISMGNISVNKGAYEEAEQFYTQALDICQSTLGKNHPDYASFIINLGLLKIEQRDSVSAENYYLQALEIFKSALGDKHPDYAGALYNLGSLYFAEGKYTDAEKCHQQALDIRKNTIGEKHIDYARSLEALCLLCNIKNEPAKSEQYFLAAIDIYKEAFVNSMSYMSEHQRKYYWDLLSPKFTKLYPWFSYVYYSQKQSTAGFAYNNELFVKGILLNATDVITRSIIESNDTTLRNQWNELIAEKQIIMALQEKDPQSLYITEHMESAEQLEKEITKASAAYRENKTLWQISWDSVCHHLASNQIAIEYMVAPINEDSTMYCALLLRRDSKYPKIIPLFEEKQVLTLINTSNENKVNKTYRQKGNGQKISNLVWSKILPYVKQGETIYFAPSGLLHQLAIESLPYDKNHTMSDSFNLVRLSSTREIVKKRKNAKHTSAVLYGGIQYNVSTDKIMAESEKYSATDLLASRGIGNYKQNRGSITFLKGTKKEVEEINALLNQNNLQVQLFTSTNANEESFKALSGKHQNILHIATHGFYWTDSTAQKKDYFLQRMVRINRDMPTLPIIDPLDRCGLLFAGAQTAWSGHSADLPDRVQDGILTAKEISLLDLRDADLVVLSACETGKGEVTGEGVFGLQRAFKQAGAQTIIMSLWPVNDAATQLLMTEFYRNWITNHQSKREAFKTAQNVVRAQHSEPYYWAGFIMLD